MSRRAPYLLLAGWLLLPAACSETARPEASEDPDYAAAVALLDEVRDETMDLTYEDERYAPVLAAFEEVAPTSPDRELADYWIQKIRAGQKQVTARRAKLRAEVNRTPEEYREYLNLLREELEEERNGVTPPARQGTTEDADREDTAPAAAAVPDGREPGRADVDNKGRSREHWQRRRRTLQARVRELTDAVASAERRALYLCSSGMTSHHTGRRTVREEGLKSLSHKPGEIAREDPGTMHCGQARQRLIQAKEALEAAQAELDGLPDEARRAGAPPGWIR